MPRARNHRCQLAARVRDRHERTGRTRPRKYHYWRTPLRICRNVAIARVLFSAPGPKHPQRACRRCFDRIARENPDTVVWFEMIHPRRERLEMRAPEGAQL